MTRISSRLSLIVTLLTLGLGTLASQLVSPASAASAGALTTGTGGATTGTGTSSQAFSNLTGEGRPEEGASAGGAAGGAAGEEPAVRNTKTNASPASSGSPSTGLVALVFVIAALLLGGIAFHIVRDSRGVTPATDGYGGELASARGQAARTRRRRAKAKAARAARKRNR